MLWVGNLVERNEALVGKWLLEIQSRIDFPLVWCNRKCGVNDNGWAPEIAARGSS